MQLNSSKIKELSFKLKGDSISTNAVKNKIE